MEEKAPVRKSALRGIWSGIFFASLAIWLGTAPSGWNSRFWGDDIVSRFFMWFFSTLGIYLGLAILAGLLYTVVRRVERGDPIKEDLGLVLSALGLIASIIGLFPELRNRISALMSWH